MNFDEYVERRNTDSIKWDGACEKFGVTHELLPMWIADMDFPSPPEVVDALVERAKHGVFGYVQKSDAFFQSIVKWMGKRHGYKIQKDWLVVTPGVIPGYTIAIQAFTNPGDGILVQMPVYYPFMDSIRNNGREIVNSPLKPKGDKYYMDFDDLETKASQLNVKMMIFCSPHNPVGRVWTRDELQKVADICLRNNVLLISDEIHGDLIMKGNKQIALATLGKKYAANMITTCAPSKTFNLAGLISSFMIIENPVIRADFVRQLNRNRIYHINNFGAVALQTAYGKCDKWVDDLNRYLDANLDYMQAYLKKHLPKLKMYRPQGTYLVWVDFSGTGLTSEQIYDRMINKAKIAVDFGEWFGPGGERHCRFNIACPRSLLEDAMARLKKAFA